jgi:peptide/nickel transport system ATP-binding protein
LTTALDEHGTAATAASGLDRGVVLDVRGLAVHIRRSDLFARLLGREQTTVYAVDDVTFHVARGETLGLVGESGCGKSSLARALAGLAPFGGEIDLGGQKVTASADIDRAYRQRLQIIFQNPDLSLNPRQRLGTILSRPLRLYRQLDGGELRAEVARQLERVKLPADYVTRYPHELSGGEKQRVAIARALAADPAVIVCDEITSGLDASVQASIVNLLREIQAEKGLAYLFITHDLNLLRHVADRVAVMYLGRVVEMRAATSLEAPPYHPYTEALLSAAPVLDERFEIRRVTLAGELPTRTSRLGGCVFESRCPRRLGDVCRDQAAPTRRMEPGHWLACHLTADDLGAVPPIWRRHRSAE